MFIQPKIESTNSLPESHSAILSNTLKQINNNDYCDDLTVKNIHYSRVPSQTISGPTMEKQERRSLSKSKLTESHKSIGIVKDNLNTLSRQSLIVQQFLN